MMIRSTLQSTIDAARRLVAPLPGRGYPPLVERLTQIGRYQVLSEVARGGMGVVYKATSQQGRQVALKLLLAGKTASPLQRRRVATEIQTLLRLRHPNVVELLDAGEHRGELRAEGVAASAAKPGEQGVPYLVMEWIAGETLARRIEREGPLDPRDAAELVQRLASALEHCHAQGVLHRDLKPDNVMVRASDGAPLLTDFGLSKDVASESQTSIVKTLVGRWLGTPGYWPPEQARGDLGQIGPRSDVYGLGAILYACLTGVPPQEGKTLQELILALDRPTVPPGQRRHGLPRWLDAVCLRALAVNPQARHDSAAELARDLSEGLAGRSSLAQARGVVAASSRGSAPMFAAALLVLGGAGATAVAVTRGSRPSSSESAPQPAPLVTAPPGPQQPVVPALPRGLVEPEPVQSADTRAEVERLMASMEAHYKAGDLAGAREDCDRAMELDPRFAQAYYSRGHLRGQQGDPAGERADYDRAIELDPRYVEAYLNRGVLRGQQGDLAGAGADYDRAIELDPRYTRAYYNRGVLRGQQGDLAGALSDLERFLELAPNDPSAPDVRAEIERLRAQLGQR